jgi:DNA-binding MarR family transcriptional regulator
MSTWRGYILRLTDPDGLCMDPLRRLRTDDLTYKMLKAHELMRLMDREIPGQLVSAFLYVASHNPCHKQAMEEDLDLQTSSGSRLIDWLSDYHRLGKPGLGLVIKYKDPSNLRRVLVKLTPKGELLARQMKEFLYG